MKTLVVCIVFFGAGLVIAQTPDGETPAKESVCDQLRTATPGLYGLCVAYCEALDCHLENGAIQCARSANPRILENYNRRKRPDDPGMPCLVTECPCWTQDEVDAMLPSAGTEWCTDNLDPDDSTNVSCVGLNTANVSPEIPCAMLIVASGSGQVQNDEGRLSCVYGEPLDCIGCTPRFRFRDLTREQTAFCSAQLETRGAEGGWDCFTGAD